MDAAWHCRCTPAIVDKRLPLLLVLGSTALTLAAFACGGFNDDPVMGPPPSDPVVTRASADTKNDVGITTWGFATSTETGDAVVHGYGARNELRVEVRETIQAIGAYTVRLTTTMSGLIAAGSENIDFAVEPASDGQTATASVTVVQNTFAGGGVAARVLAHMSADAKTASSGGDLRGASFLTQAHPLDSLVNEDDAGLVNRPGCDLVNQNQNQNQNYNQYQNQCQNQAASPAMGAMNSCSRIPAAILPLLKAILPVIGDIAGAVARAGGPASGADGGSHAPAGMDAGADGGADAGVVAGAAGAGAGAGAGSALWAFVGTVAQALTANLSQLGALGAGPDAGIAGVVGDMLDAAAGLGSAISPIMSCLMSLAGQNQANQGVQNCNNQQAGQQPTQQADASCGNP
jgi:hypothetical protein